MAKICSVNRNQKRVKLSKRHAAKRAALKATIKDQSISGEERFQAVLKLADMPRNGSKTRVRNRCAMTGRPRGYFRKFDLCRNVIRELASRGELPGIVKSSW